MTIDLRQWLRSRRPTGRRLSAPNQGDGAWRQTLRTRVAVITVLLGAWVGLVEYQLYSLQVRQHEAMARRAEAQQKRTIDVPARRGDILDRRGRVLATSIETDTLFADPVEVRKEHPDAAAVAAAVCEALGGCDVDEQEDMVGRLSRPASRWEVLRTQLSPATVERIARLDLHGISTTKDVARRYPNGSLAAQVVGFVGTESRALSGLEYAYDEQIRGRSGKAYVYTDGLRQAILREELQPSSPGGTLELTIDRYIQYVAERELEVGVRENEAEAGSAVVMNPRTGEVLAMANWPTFDLNHPKDASQAALRNRAVQDIYEPGSTFKIVTASAALEEHVVPDGQLFDVRGGQVRINSRVITDTHDYGVLSFEDVIVKSSNVGAVRIGAMVGRDRLGEYVRRFGFGLRISPDFPGESRGIVWGRDNLTESALASVSMGYQVSVTPLQMLSAISAVANQGVYMQPRVVRALEKDGRRLTVRPKPRQPAVISAETAASMTRIMEQVVERGTGTDAKIPGYSVAGKTGTANKLINGRYSTSTHASFVGFVPSTAPALAVLVMLDSPHGVHGHFGGPVAAPIFRRIAEASLSYLGVPQTVNPPAPVIVAGDDGADTPSVRTSAAARPEEPLREPVRQGVTPDVRGLGAREAVQRLAEAGCVPEIAGVGVVVGQTPEAGASLRPQQRCVVRLSRLPAGAVTAGLTQ